MTYNKQMVDAKISKILLEAPIFSLQEAQEHIRKVNEPLNLAFKHK